MTWLAVFSIWEQLIVQVALLLCLSHYSVEKSITTIAQGRAVLDSASKQRTLSLEKKKTIGTDGRERMKPFGKWWTIGQITFPFQTLRPSTTVYSDPKCFPSALCASATYHQNSPFEIKRPTEQPSEANLQAFSENILYFQLYCFLRKVLVENN